MYNVYRGSLEYEKLLQEFLLGVKVENHWHEYTDFIFLSNAVRNTIIGVFIVGYMFIPVEVKLLLISLPAIS